MHAPAADVIVLNKTYAVATFEIMNIQNLVAIELQAKGKNG